MKRYTFDAVSRTLVMSAGFAKALNDYNSDESRLYRQMLADIPALRVERKTHASPTSYKGPNDKRTSCYPTKKLSYKRMEKFMEALNDGQKFLAEYTKLREKAKQMDIPGYPPVARWFLEQFPDYRTDALFYVGNEPDVLCFENFLTEIKKVS